LKSEQSTGFIEAMLYHEPDVLKIEKIARVTGLPKDKIREYMKSLMEEYARDFHGMEIVEVAGGYIYRVKKDIYPEIKELYKFKTSEKISKSTLTVLSIIAYKQPVTRAEIEEVRGVGCDNQVRQLLERGLIQVTGRKDVLGKPLQYGTTQEFLKLFHLVSIKDLPRIEELKSDEFSLE
jgi:segregation and condensation protein B